MNKPDNALPCRPKPGSPPSKGFLAFLLLFGERLKVNPLFKPSDLEDELKCLSDELQAKSAEHAEKQKKEKK